MRRERGFGLVEVILGLALLASTLVLIVPFLLDKQKDHHAMVYADHLKNVISRLHQYQYYKVTEERIPVTDADSWPASLNHLMTDYPLRFWNECSTTQEANNECVRPDYVPWSTKRIDSRVQTQTTTPPYYSHLVLTIPLSNLVMDTKEYLRWSVPLMTIPGAKKTATQDIEITLRQATSTFIYESFLPRSGDKTLTDDWDTGGNAWITNIEGMSLRNSDGSQYSVAAGLQRSLTVASGSFIPRHSCPAGHTPDLDVMIKSIEPQNSANKFTSLGSFAPYYTAQPGGWRVYAKYYAKLQGGSQQWKLLRDAFLKVDQLCVQ